MAAPKRNRTKPTDPLFKKTREKIQISQLVTRLENNALGKLKSPQGEPIEMTQGQIASARIVVDKAMPNLSAIVLSGDEENPVAYSEVRRTIIDNA